MPVERVLPKRLPKGGALVLSPSTALYPPLLRKILEPLPFSNVSSGELGQILFVRIKSWPEAHRRLSVLLPIAA